MGMKELRRHEVPDGKYTLGLRRLRRREHRRRCSSSPTTGARTTATSIGTGFGHLAVGVPDVAATCEKLRAAGAQITREPGPVKFGTTIIAFVEDPDGYKIELVQRG